MRPLSGYLRSLDPRLPRSVYVLELGALVNAFGNGVVLPFLLIYLHNVRGIPFGLAGSGFVREGCAADLVLFDAERVIDTATFAEPVRRAEGIKGVWVNGVLTYTAEGVTGARGGRFLKRAALDQPHR